MVKSVLLVTTILLMAGSGFADSKTFVYCSEGSPSNLNPQLATDGPSFNATHEVYNRLVEFKTGETVIEPGLATSWDVSKDGLNFTFKLRKNVKFHKNALFTPARNFNADDVIFSFNRMRLKDHPFHKVSNGTYEYFDSMEMGTLIKDIVKVDENTVKFVLSRPEAPFLSNLAMDFAAILSAEYADAMMKAGTPEKMDQNPVGTGPFVFVRYDKDTMIRYEANNEYFKGKPKIDKMVFAITTDPSVRFQKLKTGECHLIAEPAPADVKAMESEAKIQVMKQSGLNVGYLAMNTQKKPFDNALVRQAINHALNKKSYIDAIYLGNAVVAKNPIPPSIWSYNNKVHDYDYSPEKAKELLTKAGFPNGFETELWTLPVSRPYNPNGKKMGEMMQSDLAKVGIKVKLLTFDWPTYLAKSRKGEHSLIQLGWTGDNGDPDNFMNVLLGCQSVESGSNTARWCDKTYDKMMQDARSQVNPKQRSKLYEEAQMLFKKEAPWVTIAHSTVFKGLSKNVSGYKMHPLGTEHFYSIDIKK